MNRTSTATAIADREVPSLSHVQGSLMVLGAGVVFSFGGLAFRAVDDDVGSWQFLVFRGLGMLGTAAAVLAVRYRSGLGSLLRQLRLAHLMAGVTLGALNTLFIVSLTVTSVAFVLMLQTLAPLTAGYFSWLVMGERPGRATIVATLISLVGVTIMVGGTVLTDLSPLSLIAFGIPVGFGYYTTLIRSVQRVDPSVPVLIAGISLVAVAAVVVVGTGGFTASGRDVGIGLFAGSALLAAPLAAFNIAQRVVPAAQTTLLLMSEVVLAPVWVWLFVGEAAGGATIVGGSIILVAVVWLTLHRVPVRGRRPITSQG